MARQTHAVDVGSLFPELETFRELPIPTEVREYIEHMDKLGREIVQYCNAFRNQFPASHDTKHAASPVPARMELFKRLHLERFKLPAAIDYPKDMKILKDIVETYGEETSDELITAFFKVSDPFLEQQTGFTVGMLKKKLPGLISARNRPRKIMGVTQNTRANGEHSEQAAGMIRRAYGG